MPLGRAWIEKLIKHNQVVQALYRGIGSAALQFAGLFLSRDDQLFLFTAYGGRRYGDSPKVLFDAMKQDPRYQNARFVWGFINPNEFEVEGAEKIKIDTPKYFITALRARAWITNVNIERGLHFKKKGCVYLNTWHGTGPKKGGNAVEGRKDYDFSTVNILCYDGEYQKQVYLNWFGAGEKNLFHCGRPRDDELFHYTPQRVAEIRKDLNLPENKRVVLYVPTWRETDNRPLSYPLWEERLGEDYVLLVRTHHFAKHQLPSGDGRFCRDVSDYPDINDLYMVSDVLISDYSSAFFDYALLGRPIICYAYDYDAYCRDVGLFMDLEAEFPGGICRTEEQVLDRLTHMDLAEAGRETVEYRKKYIDRPDNATQMCLDRLWEELGKDEAKA